jgi:protease-4
VGSLVKDGKSSSLLTGDNKIGILPIQGVIMDSDKTLKQIHQWEEDSGIKGVIVRIDSPGGAVAPSQEIYEAIKRLKKTKPVISSFESTAASGGYYIAVATDKIYTNPGTITGSIGVIMDFINLGEVYKWAKVDRYNLKSGKFKDVGSDTRPMSPEEKAIMQDTIMNVYEQFVGAVAEGRKLPKEKVRTLADGRIYTGDQAVKLGLADKLGTLDDAVDEMKSLAKIKGKPKLIYPNKPKPRLLDVLTSQLVNGVVESLVGGLGTLESENRNLRATRVPFFL